MYRDQRSLWRLLLAAMASALFLSGTAAGAQGTPEPAGHEVDEDTLVGRAVLPAATFADGPTSGQYIGDAGPFVDAQPVQGFSAILDAGDGTFWGMSDNGFGSITNSPDYRLRVYRIDPSFKTAEDDSGDGTIDVVEFIELHDPDNHIPFAIVNEFSESRPLTGADFDLESLQIAADGTLWFGDEFGPFLIQTDADGKVLQAPIPLVNPDDGTEVRAPQNPFNEEISTLRVMNAVRQHAFDNGGDKTPVVSPWEVMLVDDDPTTVVPNRATPTGDLAAASSEIHNVAELQRAGYQVVPYTINDKDRMVELLELGVNGIITDRPDLLRVAIEEFDSSIFLDDGRIDPSRLDAQGHRGARNLRPENTLPGMEVALDLLMNTLETDSGVTLDGVSMLDHDPAIESGKCRNADGTPYTDDNEVLMRDLTAADIQARFICDGLFRGPEQVNDLDLSPVSVAFAAQNEFISPYVIPTVENLVDFVEFYEAWYTDGPGAEDEDAAVRALNASEVRFNIETKINPRADFAARTFEPQAFVDGLGVVLDDEDLSDRLFIQSFDWRTLLLVQEQHPGIQTVYLFGDFTGDGTNLQDENGANTPWLAGLFWPYRSTVLDNPFTARTSRGFEGMAVSPNGRTLYPLLEGPIAGDDTKLLRMFEFDVQSSSYTGDWWGYRLDDRGGAIGDFILFDRDQGLVIERDGSQGDLDGFKTIYEIKIGEPGTEVQKELAVDLMNIADPDGISLPGDPGDVGIGDPFAFPFVTIEDVVVLGPDTIGVLNDNNYPFSVGRHVGTGEPDDNEFIVIELSDPLGLLTARQCNGLDATIVGFGNGATIMGTDGDDVIIGTEGRDIIRAGRGNDVVCGEQGRDEIAGGPGDDVLIGGMGSDGLVGADGIDRCKGSAGRDLYFKCETVEP